MEKFINKPEYLDFTKLVKVSSGIVFFLVLFIYFSQFFSDNYFIKVFEVFITVFFIVFLVLTFIKSLELIRVLNLEMEDKYELNYLRKIIGMVFLIAMFFLGFFLVFIFTSYTNYHIGADVLGVFLMSVPILSIYSIFFK